MYGITIKKIRLEKGLTQKEVCSDIISLSYYSRIEREINEPTITVFLKILNRLNINFDEFMYIHNNYKEPQEEIIWFTITELYHSGNLKELSNQKKALLSSEQQSPFLIEIIDLFILRLNHQNINKINTKHITKKLIDTENWTNSEVKIFITVMDVLPIETLIIIVNRLLKKRNLYMKSKGYNSPYSKILINTVLLCIDNSYIIEAETYLTEYKKTLETRDMYGHCMHMYLYGLLLHLKGH
ncbi:helix-turn-helix domain-containing protein, partial [Enterococcus faecalis]|nr:helix-turn-helix domain-containing protein [Enterococcus faecalis]